MKVEFRVRNNGPESADAIHLKVNLPLELDHKTLRPSDTVVREIENTLKPLSVGAHRDTSVVITPMTDGIHIGTVEVLLNGVQIDMKAFEVRAGDFSRDRDAPVIPIQPQPDRPTL